MFFFQPLWWNLIKCAVLWFQYLSFTLLKFFQLLHIFACLLRDAKIWYVCHFHYDWLWMIWFHVQGKAIGKKLHTYPQHASQPFRRILRLFSLQMMQHPIEITIKELFTFNYVLLKSVSLNQIFIISNHYNFCSHFPRNV